MSCLLGQSHAWVSDFKQVRVGEVPRPDQPRFRDVDRFVVNAVDVVPALSDVIRQAEGSGDPARPLIRPLESRGGGVRGAPLTYQHARDAYALKGGPHGGKTAGEVGSGVFRGVLGGSGTVDITIVI